MSKNLKEYLKKYSHEPKKKKKRTPATNKHLRIIDDDEFSFNDMKNDDEMIFTKEDAPQIVGVIDERPPELIANDFKNSDKWKGIISNNGDNSNQKKLDKQDLSPLRLQKKSRKSTSPDLSPKRSKVSPDLSPDRSRTSKKKYSPDLSPDRSSNYKKKYSPDLSPQRQRSSSSKNYSTDNKSRNKNQYTERSNHSNRNNSPDISRDTANKDSSSQRFKNSTNISQTKAKQSIHPDEYQNQEVVRRDRRTGKRITLESTLHDKKEKDKKQEVKNEKYTRWGLGIKQIEAYEQKVQEDTHEMSKPLARFSDDVDLDNHLKNQFRDGDPMLEYIRQKDTENKLISGKPSVPMYKGSFPINRFNIRPGYRWDGVNRSNGYEEKWFEVINKRKATEEQAYRYSTEDM